MHLREWIIRDTSNSAFWKFPEHALKYSTMSSFHLHKMTSSQNFESFINLDQYFRNIDRIGKEKENEQLGGNGFDEDIPHGMHVI